MSIEQNWKQLNEQGDDDLSSLLRPGRIQKLQSSSPLRKIKYYLAWSMVYSAVIAALYIYIMIRFPHWPILTCIGLVMIFTIWAGYTSYLQYKGINLSAAGSQSLLGEMERHYNGIQEWMRLQMKVATFIYPVAAAGGFMLGGMQGSGKSIAYFMSKPIVVVILIVVTAILVPCCIWLAKWLFKKSFGKHLTALKKNIDELKAGT